MNKKKQQMAEYKAEVAGEEGRVYKNMDQRISQFSTGATRDSDLGIHFPLTRNKSALVSGCDIEFLQEWRWCAVKKGGIWYASRGLSDGTTIYMHREIARRAGIISDYIDHIDRNGLNNTRSNLRAATQGQNIANAGMFKNNTTGFRGVTYDKSRGCYKAAIKFNQKYKFIGRFATPVEAASAYDEAAKILFGDFAFQNNVIEVAI